MFLDPGDATAENLHDAMTLPDGTTGYYATGSYAMNGLLRWGTKTLPDLPLVMISERPQVCRTVDGEVIHNLWGLGFVSPHMPAFAAPGQPAPDFAAPLQRVGEPCDPRLPGGPHRAGLLAAMTDGSVRVFGWDTDPSVFWAACTPPGEE